MPLRIIDDRASTSSEVIYNLVACPSQRALALCQCHDGGARGSFCSLDFCRIDDRCACAAPAAEHGAVLSLGGSPRTCGCNESMSPLPTRSHGRLPTLISIASEISLLTKCAQQSCAKDTRRTKKSNYDEEAREFASEAPGSTGTLMYGSMSSCGICKAERARRLSASALSLVSNVQVRSAVGVRNDRR